VEVTTRRENEIIAQGREPSPLRRRCHFSLMLMVIYEFGKMESMIRTIDWYKPPWVSSCLSLLEESECPHFLSGNSYFPKDPGVPPADQKEQMHRMYWLAWSRAAQGIGE
jgi:hypothetical protein